MKLRVRSLETKETIRVEALDSSSLFDLKTLIAANLSFSSSIPPQSIRLSLNRKDELQSSSPDDSLQSLGLTSGDLVFYTLETLTSAPNPKQVTETLVSASVSPEEIANSDPPPLPERMDETSLSLGADLPQDGMEVDVEPSLMEKSTSLPCFLKRIMQAEQGHVEGNLGLIMIAVQAIFLESGFVVCGRNGSRLPEGWPPSSAVMGSISYIIPDIVASIEERDVKVAILKFSVMGNYVSIYGFLSGDHPDVYRLCLDVSKLVPLLISAMSAVSAEEEKEIFQLWKIVKDGLCLPLLVDICEKNGLPPPPCFARLPTELKLMVLELLPGVDVARVGCTSSELRYLASNDEIWKQKFVEEFGLWDERGLVGRSWKEKFVRSWVRRRDANKRIERGNIYSLFVPRQVPATPQRFMIGGNYDRFPAIGGFGPIGPGLGFPRLPARRIFSPDCNLGGRNTGFSG